MGESCRASDESRHLPPRDGAGHSGLYSLLRLFRRSMLCWCVAALACLLDVELQPLGPQSRTGVSGSRSGVEVTCSRIVLASAAGVEEEDGERRAPGTSPSRQSGDAVQTTALPREENVRQQWQETPAGSGGSLGLEQGAPSPVAGPSTGPSAGDPPTESARLAEGGPETTAEGSGARASRGGAGGESTTPAGPSRRPRGRPRKRGSTHSTRRSPRISQITGHALSEAPGAPPGDDSGGTEDVGGGTKGAGGDDTAAATGSLERDSSDADDVSSHAQGTGGGDTTQRTVTHQRTLWAGGMGKPAWLFRRMSGSRAGPPQDDQVFAPLPPTPTITQTTEELTPTSSRQSVGGDEGASPGQEALYDLFREGPSTHSEPYEWSEQMMLALPKTPSWSTSQPSVSSSSTETVEVATLKREMESPAGLPTTEGQVSREGEVHRCPEGAKPVPPYGPHSADQETTAGPLRTEEQLAPGEQGGERAHVRRSSRRRPQMTGRTESSPRPEEPRALQRRQYAEELRAIRPLTRRFSFFLEEGGSGSPSASGGTVDPAVAVMRAVQQMEALREACSRWMPWASPRHGRGARRPGTRQKRPSEPQASRVTVEDGEGSTQQETAPAPKKRRRRRRRTLLGRVLKKTVPLQQVEVEEEAETSSQKEIPIGMPPPGGEVVTEGDSMQEETSTGLSAGQRSVTTPAEATTEGTGEQTQRHRGAEERALLLYGSRLWSLAVRGESAGPQPDRAQQAQHHGAFQREAAARVRVTGATWKTKRRGAEPVRPLEEILRWGGPRRVELPVYTEDVTQAAQVRTELAVVPEMQLPSPSDPLEGTSRAWSAFYSSGQSQAPLKAPPAPQPKRRKVAGRQKEPSRKKSRSEKRQESKESGQRAALLSGAAPPRSRTTILEKQLLKFPPTTTRLLARQQLVSRPSSRRFVVEVLERQQQRDAHRQSLLGLMQRRASRQRQRYQRLQETLEQQRTRLRRSNTGGKKGSGTEKGVLAQPVQEGAPGRRRSGDEQQPGPTPASPEMVVTHSEGDVTEEQKAKTPPLQEKLIDEPEVLQPSPEASPPSTILVQEGAPGRTGSGDEQERGPPPASPDMVVTHSEVDVKEEPEAKTPAPQEELIDEREVPQLSPEASPLPVMLDHYLEWLLQECPLGDSEQSTLQGLMHDDWPLDVVGILRPSKGEEESSAQEQQQFTESIQQSATTPPEEKSEGAFSITATPEEGLDFSLSLRTPGEPRSSPVDDLTSSRSDAGTRRQQQAEGDSRSGREGPEGPVGEPALLRRAGRGAQQQQQLPREKEQLQRQMQPRSSQPQLPPIGEEGLLSRLRDKKPQEKAQHGDEAGAMLLQQRPLEPLQEPRSPWALPGPQADPSWGGHGASPHQTPVGVPQTPPAPQVSPTHPPAPESDPEEGTTSMYVMRPPMTPLQQQQQQQYSTTPPHGSPYHPGWPQQKEFAPGPPGFSTGVRQQTVTPGGPPLQPYGFAAEDQSSWGGSAPQAFPALSHISDMDLELIQSVISEDSSTSSSASSAVTPVFQKEPPHTPAFSPMAPTPQPPYVSTVLQVSSEQSCTPLPQPHTSQHRLEWQPSPAPVPPSFPPSPWHGPLPQRGQGSADDTTGAQQHAQEEYSPEPPTHPCMVVEQSLRGRWWAAAAPRGLPSPYPVPPPPSPSQLQQPLRQQPQSPAVPETMGAPSEASARPGLHRPWVAPPSPRPHSSQQPSAPASPLPAGTTAPPSAPQQSTAHESVASTSSSGSPPSEGQHESPPEQPSTPSDDGSSQAPRRRLQEYEPSDKAAAADGQRERQLADLEDEVIAAGVPWLRRLSPALEDSPLAAANVNSREEALLNKVDEGLTERQMLLKSLACFRTVEKHFTTRRERYIALVDREAPDLGMRDDEVLRLLFYGTWVACYSNAKEQHLQQLLDGRMKDEEELLLLRRTAETPARFSGKQHRLTEEVIRKFARERPADDAKVNGTLGMVYSVLVVAGLFVCLLLLHRAYMDRRLAKSSGITQKVPDSPLQCEVELAHRRPR